MIISHLHQFIFVRTKKTASTSLEIALAGTTGPRDVVPIDVAKGEEVARRAGGSAGRNSRVPRTAWGAREWARWFAGKPDIHFHNHMPAAEIRRYVGRQIWDSYLTFAVDRNPWDLTVSAFSWRNARHPGEWSSFEAFVASPRLEKYSNWKRYTIDGNIAVDLLFRYDDLDNALTVLDQRLGIGRLMLPTAKAGYRDRDKPFQTWYTEASRQRIAHVFQAEIAHFGWKFE